MSFGAIRFARDVLRGPPTFSAALHMCNRGAGIPEKVQPKMRPYSSTGAGIFEKVQS